MTFSFDMIGSAAKTASYVLPETKTRAIAGSNPKKPMLNIGMFKGGAGRARFNSPMRQLMEESNKFGKYVKIAVANFTQDNIILFFNFSKSKPGSPAESRITSTMTDTSAPFFNFSERANQIINVESDSDTPALEAMQQLYGNFEWGGSSPDDDFVSGKLYTLPEENDNDAFVVIERKAIDSDEVKKLIGTDAKSFEKRRLSSKAQGIVRSAYDISDEYERSAFLLQKCGDDAALIELSQSLINLRLEKDMAKEVVGRVMEEELPDGEDNSFYWEQIESEISDKTTLNFANKLFLDAIAVS